MYMKRLFIFLVLVGSLFLSCRPKGQRCRVIEKSLPIEVFVAEFIRNNPNYSLNDITKEESNELFTKQILDTLKSYNLLYGIPMKLKHMNKVNGKIMIQLEAWIKPYDWQYRGIDNIYVDLLGNVNDSLVPSLKTDEYYCIDGRLLKRVTSINTVQKLMGKRVSVYTPRISIEKDPVRIVEPTNPEVHLGILHFAIDSIKPFKGRDTEIIYY